jgi:putative oxidoreductase
VKWLKGISMLLGRILLAWLFLMAGFGKLTGYEMTKQYMEAKGMTLVPFFLISAAIFEILGGLALLLGYKTRWGALLLIIMLVPATLIFHDFWNLAPPDDYLQRMMFGKNLGILGGLFTILGCGGGMLAFDNYCRHKHEKQ